MKTYYTIRKRAVILILLALISCLIPYDASGSRTIITEAKSAKDSGRITVSGIKDDYIVLKINQQRSLTVSAGMPDADAKWHWGSSNNAIATVSESGVVKAVKKGRAKITVSLADSTIQPYTFTLEAVPADTQIYKDGFYYHPITSDIKKRITGKSYTENKNISLGELKYVRIKHYGYGGTVRTGELIVNQAIAKDMAEIFYELYKLKYPIQKMKLIDEYDADDSASMSDNNTSSFNYRTVSGSDNLSNHAYGFAIDINPRINPYVKGGKVLPTNGAVYAQRNTASCKGRYKDNMIHKNDAVYRLFTEHGFQWGGDWKYSKDYQHFEKIAA